MQSITWLVWFTIMVFGNIVSMNFIIAVVSDSYNKSIAKSAQTIAQQYRLKVPFIIKRESRFKGEQEAIKKI